MISAPALSVSVNTAELARTLAPMQRACEQVQRSLQPVFKQIETMRSAITAAQSELRAYKAEQRARRAQQREQAQRNNQRLLQFLHTRLTRRVSAHLGLFCATHTHAQRVAHDRTMHTHAQRAPLATCQAMNAPGAQSLSQYKNATMRD